MVKIVVLGFGIAIQTPGGGAYTFDDVPPDHPFFAFIETAAAHNIVSGYGCGPASRPATTTAAPTSAQQPRHARPVVARST